MLFTARHSLSLRIRKQNTVSLISFFTLAFRFLALFLRKWLLHDFCSLFVWQFAYLTSHLRILQCNSPVSVRFRRTASSSKLFSSWMFDWTIWPCRETRARGTSVPQRNAARTHPLDWNWPPLTHPHVHVSWPAGMQAHPSQPQLVLCIRFRSTEGH